MESAVKDFRELKVWDLAHRLTLDVYTATAAFPKDELYGLTGQIRRCSASIPANIAEGCGRGSNAEFARFLHIAMGSASELDYHLLLAHDLRLLEQQTYTTLVANLTQIRKMLFSLLQKVRAAGSG